MEVPKAQRCVNFCQRLILMQPPVRLRVTVLTCAEVASVARVSDLNGARDSTIGDVAPAGDRKRKAPDGLTDHANNHRMRLESDGAPWRTSPPHRTEKHAK